MLHLLRQRPSFAEAGAASSAGGTRIPVKEGTIETATLEEVLYERGVGVVALMWMDIEGFEYGSILGSPALFGKHRARALALELHRRALVSGAHAAEDVLSFLKGHGYRLDTRFEHNKTNSVWVAPDA